jgi:hypothetical protein
MSPKYGVTLLIRFYYFMCGPGAGCFEYGKIRTMGPVKGG